MNAPLDSLTTAFPILAQTGGIGWADIAAILPAVVLFATGSTVLMIDLFLRGWNEPAPTGEKWILHFLSLLGTAVAAALVCASLAKLGAKEGGNGGAYFYKAIVVDRFSLAIALLVILGTALSLLAAVDTLRRLKLEHGEFHCLLLCAAGAMVLFAQSASLTMLFLSLETLSMAVFVLTAYTRDEKRSVEAALKYFLLGGFSSAFLLFGLVLIYGATRATNLVDIAAALGAAPPGADVPLFLTGAALALIGLCFKVGAFPFHSWLPDAYEGAPAVVSSFMAVTVKSASFAVLLRFLFPLSLAAGSPDWERVREVLAFTLSIIAVLTMVFGNVVAVAQKSVKRMLAYSAIAHTGYLLIGIVAAVGSGPAATADPAGASGAVLFYLFPYALMTPGAFIVISYLGKGGGERETFADYRGLAVERPFVALALAVLMISFAGIPPTAGFWGKLYLFREAVAAGRWGLALVGIVTSVISAYYYLRLVVNMYMRGGGAERRPEDETRTASGFAVAFTALAVVLVGLFPEQLLRLSIALAQP